MQLSVVGTGYVGLVTGTCLAESGNDVVCLDIDADKVARLSAGDVPIYEPGLAELVDRNQQAGRLRFTTDAGEAIAGARLVFLAVGTPPADDGSVDLSALRAVVDTIAPLLAEDAIVVTKSTVPVGTCAWIEAQLAECTGRPCQVASNPEFLKEGAALEDFQKPDRVVVGSRSEEVADVLAELYAPFLRTEHPFLVMSPESAEMTKYVANALLATKISFINEAANLCGRMGADINDVRRGIGHDRRIGFAFLFPGVGYGGSCFPKDVRALAAMARQQGLHPLLLDAVHEVNEQQKSILLEKIVAHFREGIEDRGAEGEGRAKDEGGRMKAEEGSVSSRQLRSARPIQDPKSQIQDPPHSPVPRPSIPDPTPAPSPQPLASSPSRPLAPFTIAIWGLAFKPRTDDIRDAPALALIDRLLELGAKLQVHDPEALENVRRRYGDALAYFAQPLEALTAADALVVMTEWGEFRHPNFAAMRRLMNHPVVFDGRNLWEPEAMQAAGFTYHSIGRASVGELVQRFGGRG